MALIAFAADKGAPGVTTTALALAAVWPRSALLAECDLGGGDLVYRLPAASGQQLDPTTGVASLAAAARRGLAADQVWPHTQRLVGGLDVMVGPADAAQANALAGMWGPLGQVFERLSGVDVFADCGRVFPGSPSLDLIDQASMLVFVMRPTVEHLAHTRERLIDLSSRYNASSRPGPSFGVIVVAPPKTLAADVSQVRDALTVYDVSAEVIGGLAQDSKGAQMLRGAWGGGLGRTPLIRSARALAQTMAGRLAVPLVEAGG